MGLFSALFNVVKTIAPNVVSAVTNAVTTIANTVVSMIQGNAELPEPPAQSNIQPKPPAVPAGPSSEEIRQQQINRRASRFDRDIGRKARPTLDGDAPFYNELTPDIATDFRGRTNPADLILAAASNPVIYGIVEMMKHERPTLAAFMQHPVRSTADTLRLLFADAVHYERFTAEAAAWWDQLEGNLWLSEVSDLATLTKSRLHANSKGLYKSYFYPLEQEQEGVETLLNDLEQTYGITIINTGGPELTAEALNNYLAGAEQMALLFEAVALSEGLDVDRYQLFRAIMGDMIIDRTNIRPSGAYNRQGNPVGNALSTGHIIYDIFDNGRKGHPEGMNASNLTHELFHSFGNFAGLGNYWNTPYTQNTRAYFDLMRQVDDEGETLVRKSKASGATRFTSIVPANILNAPANSEERRNYCRDNSTVITGNCEAWINTQQRWNTQGYQDDQTTEILADYLLNVSLGNIELDPATRNLLLLSMRNAALYNLPIEQQVALYQDQEYLRVSGEPATIYGIATVTFAGRGRIRDTELNEVSGVTAPGENYPILGKVRHPDYEEPFVATIRNGRVVGLNAVLFEGLNLDDVPEYDSLTQFEFAFDSAISLSETSWAFSLFEKQ